MPPEYGDEDTFAWGWLLLADRPEHLPCGAWTYDSRDGAMLCGCGAVLWRLEQVGA